MIDISQWRAAIGGWNCSKMSVSTEVGGSGERHTDRAGLLLVLGSCLVLGALFRLFLCSLILLSGDVELNPGPTKSGKETMDGDFMLLVDACESNNIEMVRHLVIDKHCDVNAKGRNSYTPLHYACEKGHFEIVKILTNYPECNIEAEDNFNDRPLHKACESGNVDIVRHLVIDKHCDVNAKGRNSYTPLHYACEKGHFEIVKILTNYPECNIEAEDNFNDRPLHKACESGNVDIVRHLVIDKHCDVNAKVRLGYTPLHWACKKGHFEIVKILTNHPQCNIEAEDNSNNRPLHKACESGNVDIVRHLVIDKHCDINAKGRNDYTPLHYACEKGHFEIVKILTNHPQCNIEAEDNLNRRPLHVALNNRSPNMNIINYLVEVKGCNTQGITTQNRKTQNYLHNLQSSGIALLRVVKCILTGPPGAGKSTLKKRLLNQSLDTGPSLSSLSTGAAVQVNSFRKLSQHNAVVTTEWKELELDEEAVLITKRLLPANNTSDESTKSTTPHEASDDSTGTPQPTSVDETVGLTSSFQNKQESPKEFDLSPITSQQGSKNACTSSPMCMEAAAIDTVVIDESSIMEHENIPYSPAKILNCERKESNTEVQNSSSSVNDCVKGLLDYVMKIPVRKREEYERKFEESKDDSHTMLHIIDTGGQPEFHEILPALITGPAINLLVFKLTEDLRSRYEIIYRTSAGDSKPYETSLTHEEVIFRSLASIACLRQNTIGWSFDEIPIEDNSEPVAFLIATHRDLVDENKVSEVNQQLRTKIENSSHLFDSDLIQFSQSEQVIFPLDTTKDEEEVDHLRSLLHKIMSQRFQELKIPASWCTLSLKLRKSKRNIFKYDTCFKLAQECGIKDTKEFKKVLWHLHHRVGIIMHYPNVAGLEDIIITDLQLVFDRITNLITTCFTFEQSGSAAVEREFRKNGRFSESQLDEMSLREKGDPLNAKRLVALLKHLYIVAGPIKTKVGRKTVKYYFMPCALKPADVEREERDGSVSPAPLLICFECGYTPVGVFCCLLAYLLDQKTDQVLEWKLTGNDQYRNRITFQVGQYDIVTLVNHATYLEVWVQQIKGLKLSTSDLCDKILSSLDKGLVTVTQSLHYTYKSKHMFGVPCTCTAVPHPAVIDHNEETTLCANGKMVELNQNQLYWSSKVVNLTMAHSKAPSQTELGIPTISSSSSKAAKNMKAWRIDSKQDFSGSSRKKIREYYADTIQDDLLVKNFLASQILPSITKGGNQREGRTEETRFKNEGPKKKENQEALLESRLEAAQENLPASKRFKMEYGDSHDYIKSTFSEGQSSDETRKRQLNEDQDDLLTSKKFKISDNIDAAETETNTKLKISLSHIAKLQSEIETLQKQKKVLILQNEKLKSLLKDHNEQKEETAILQETDTVCTYISKNDISQLSVKLELAEDDWYHIGQHLELKESVLTKIKEMTQVDSRLTHVLETWCHEKDRTITELKESLKRMGIHEVKNSKEVQTQIETENKEMQTTQITLDKEIQFNYLVPSQDNLEGLSESQIAGKKLFLVQGDKPQLMNWEEYGLRISVPEDSLSASDTVEVSVLALVGGHFKFPDNTRLVSAVYAISTSPLLKSLRIEMQHCIDLSDPSLCKYLKFAVAPVHTASLPYKFSIIEGGEFPAYQRYGSIERSKFCQLAIVGEEEEENGDSGDEGDKEKGQTTEGEGQGAGVQEIGAGEGVGVKHQQQKEDKQVDGQLKQKKKNKEEKEEHDNRGREGQKLLQVKESEHHIEEQSQVAGGTKSAELGSQTTIVFSTHSTGVPEGMMYAGQVFYQREEGRDLMRFTAARDLNALLRYIEKKYSHPEIDQSISFKLKSPKRCIKLKFDEEQARPTTGWEIIPHIDPCQIREHQILHFGDNSTTVSPFCLLVSIYAEDSPDTVSKLSYSVPLKGVHEQMKIIINRPLRNMSSSSSDPVNINRSPSAPSAPTLNSTFRSDIAHRVMTECTSSIKDCGIDINFLVDKLLEHKIVNSREKRKITAKETDDDKMDELLHIILSSIHMDGKVFGIFINILREEDTLRTIALADTLMDKYKE